LRAAPSNTRLLGVQYRHAIHQECAFPAALQDGLAAWLHLVVDCGFDPKDVIMTGDSAGAGLSWSLTAYLALVNEQLTLGIPGRVSLFSVRLSLRSGWSTSFVR
jgi:acetyl esterase/lipase